VVLRLGGLLPPKEPFELHPLILMTGQVLGNTITTSRVEPGFGEDGRVSARSGWLSSPDLV
jgi:hypothetical protein